MKLGVYIHVPFCRRKCDYCSFYSVPVDPHSPEGRAGLEAYARTIISEASMRLPQLPDAVIDTVYFGGGTPSMLEPRQVENVLSSLRGWADLEPGAEVTIEVNPEDSGKVAAFRDAGASRAVLGIQTFDPGMHRAIGRSSSLCGDDHLDSFFSVKGIVHCADMIAGIPGQDRAGLVAGLDRLCSRGAKHLSVYLLSIEKSTPLASRMKPGPGAGEEQRALFEAVMDFLAGRGFSHYEISNFALPGYESRHNMKYWKFRPYLGLGPGAHSFIDGRRIMNVTGAGDYACSGGFSYEEDVRGKNSAAVEYLMTGLRLLEGVSVGEMESRTGFRLTPGMLARIDSLEKRGLVVLSGKGVDMTVRLSREGIFLSDGVIYEIVEELL